MEGKEKDLIIIGGGPAGLSAAIYGKRAMLDQVIIEKNIYGGGQIAVTDRVDNYPGLYGISGYELAMKLQNHAKELGVDFYEGEVADIQDLGEWKEVVLTSGEVMKTKAVFISTGAVHKTLGCKGEKELTGAGVSYCATCDGAFFKNKTVAVVGGGNVALGDAIYLSNLCEKVYLIHRREELRGAKSLQNTIFEKDNIEFLPFFQVEEILGDTCVRELVLKNNKSGESIRKNVDGVFIAVGMHPNSELVANLVETDKSGYVLADDCCRSSVPGIYAIGDVRTKQLRQVVTAVSDGAVAISSLEQDMTVRI